MGLYRCAELTDQRGFRFFVVIESSGQIQTSYMTSTRSTAYGSSGNITPVNKHEAVFHIKMFGVVDRPANAYDAREIMQNVGPKIGASDK
jgi:hypothetical protein